MAERWIPGTNEMTIPKRKFPYASLWVNAVYMFLEWIDYSIVGRLSSSTMYRYRLMDRHCKCELCMERRSSPRPKWTRSI